jgi:hypothetical protein
MLIRGGKEKKSWNVSDTSVASKNNQISQDFATYFFFSLLQLQPRTLKFPRIAVTVKSNKE